MSTNALGPRYAVQPEWSLPIAGPNREVAGIAVNSRAEVHVLTRTSQPVLVFDIDGHFLRSWGEGAFTFPHGIAIDPDDRVYVADSVDCTVRQFTREGELRMTLGRRDEPSDTGYTGDFGTVARAAGPFNSPTGVAIDANGDILVSDGYGNARVHRFSSAGVLKESWGEPGDGPGQFRIPHGVSIDRHQNIYVADRENERIQVFDRNGRLSAIWSDARRPADVFITPDDLVYVADMGYRAGIMAGMDAPIESSLRGRVTVRDLDGRVLAEWGGDILPADPDPCAAGNFFAPHGLCVGADGAVYVGEVVHSARDAQYAAGTGWVGDDCHPMQVFRRLDGPGSLNPA